MSKKDKYIKTELIGYRCKHLEGAMVDGMGPHICDACKITALEDKIRKLTENSVYEQNIALKECLKNSQKSVGELKEYNHAKGERIRILEAEVERRCPHEREHHAPLFSDVDKFRAENKALRDEVERLRPLTVAKGFSNTNCLNDEHAKLEAELHAKTEALAYVLHSDWREVHIGHKVNRLELTVDDRIKKWLMDSLKTSPTSSRYEALLAVVEAARMLNPIPMELFDALSALDRKEDNNE